MHLEAEIELLCRCTWRPCSFEIRGVFVHGRSGGGRSGGGRSGGSRSGEGRSGRSRDGELKLNLLVNS